MNAEALLQSAREGDEQAFAALVEPHRAELHAHCYRMLGSVHDAEEALQEALLRAWRALGSFEGRSSLRSWLYTIATNACLRAIERRPQRVLPVDYGPPADPHDPPAARISELLWIEPYADVEDTDAGPDARYEQRESIELAFVAALQHLPGKQRAVLILRDVLGFSAREVAEILTGTPVSIDSALQRARAAVERRLPAQSQQQTLRELGDARLSELVGGYVDAWERGDVDAVVALLTDEARVTMPPIPSWYVGREDARRFFAERVLRDERPRRLLPIVANGSPAFGQYFFDQPSGRLLAHGITVLAFKDGLIDELTAFLDADAFAQFGLPPALEL